MVSIPLAKGCLLVIPKAVYLAGLRKGKQFRRRAALARRSAKDNAKQAPTA